MSGQLGVSFLFLPVRVVYVKWSVKDADNWFLEENEAALSVSVIDSEIVSFLIQRGKKKKKWNHPISHMCLLVSLFN